MGSTKIAWVTHQAGGGERAMPKAAPYRLMWDPLQGYTVHDTHSQQVLAVAPGSSAWFDWLSRIPSFTFSGQHGHLTIRQESRSRGTYWYAYRRVGGRMAKRYLGRTAELTPAHLEQVAIELATDALSFRQDTPIRGGARARRLVQPIPIESLAAFPSATSTRQAVPTLSESLRDVWLVTRLHVPGLRPQLVHRPRLIKQLQQGMQARLILLSAPTGFGKTTLLAQWLAERQIPAAWASLEPADNDPVRFLTVLIATLQRVDAQLGMSALACLQPSPPAPSPSPETVVALLVNDLHQHTSRDFVLVLDDYHVIETKVLHQVVTYLVEHAPLHLHVIIATRTDPALPLARLRARNHLCEMRAAQLQFRPEEASTFLQEVMGLDLSAEVCTTLQHRTEGWIAGLQLAALSLREHADVQQFLSEFTGSHRYIVDYLTEEVLARQPEDVQSFLLQTSLLERFTSPLCNAVTGRSNAEQMLGYLEQANLFLVPLDEQRQWYRYHHLFAEVLRARLQRQMGSAELAALYRRASAWYEQNGMQALAVEAALSAGDFRQAARLIDIDAPLARSMLLGYEARTLIGWLERFPREVVFTDARLCLLSAYSLGIAETTDAYEAPLAAAERLFQAEGNRTGLGQAYTLRTLAASLRGDTEQAIRYGSQAFELLPDDALIERSVAANGLAEGYRLVGDVAAARQILIETRPLREQTGNVASVLGDTLACGDLLVMQGRLHEAAALYRSVLEKAGERQSFSVRALLGLGNIARERNELDQAEANLAQAITIADKIQDQVLLAHAALLSARAVQARGDAGRARDAWASSLKLAQACSSMGLLEQAQAYQARGWLQQGCMEEVSRWRQTCPLALDAPPHYQQEVIALTLVRVLLAQGEGSEALRLLARWHHHARAQGRTGSEIEMLVLSALIHSKQGKVEQSVQLLQQTLLLAAPEGYVRVLVDEGESMAALLHMVLSRRKGKNEADYVQRVLSALQAEQRTPGSFSFSAPPREPPLEALTAREQKVLRGLSAGLSNAEIAAELVVSINTVKTQARSIYRKLNVKNRQEAVATAQTWKLL